MLKLIFIFFFFPLFSFESGLEIGGEMNLTAAIQVAQLALKHRQNKKQQQRIIIFAGRYAGAISHTSFEIIIYVV